MTEEEKESGPRLNIETILHNPKYLYGLHTELASGQLPGGGSKFFVRQLLATNSILIDIEGKRKIVIHLRHIMDAVIKEIDNLEDEVKT